MHGRREFAMKVYFDGGCQPNPGKMEIAVVARGESYFLDDIGDGTNGDAEWLALIHAVRIAQQLAVRDIILLGDSVTVINQAKGIAKCRGAALQRHFEEFRNLTADMPGLRVRKIGRHQNLAGIALARRHLASRQQ